MKKEKILDIAQYCSDNQCSMEIFMKTGERKVGTALHLIRDEFLIIRSIDKNDLIKIEDVHNVKCAWQRTN
jgi:hypothetical protein